MSYRVNNKAKFTNDGIPYLWNSGDVTTPPSNEVKITASGGSVGDSFGWSVSAGSGRIVVGAYLGDSGAVNNCGAAYIFDLEGNELAKITASDASNFDFFGWSVSAGSGRIVVSATLILSNSSSGAIYLYDLDGNQLSKITASDTVAQDTFGVSVAIGSGRIVVGEDGDDDNGSNSGSAYIFDLDGNELTKITASDGAADDGFGTSVAVGSGRIVVGAYNHNSAAGAAYIFDLDGNQITKITASDGAANDFFGWSVSAGSGRIVVGAYQHNSITGAAYVFDLDGNELAKIEASDGAAGDRFGRSISVGSGRIVVGADESDANGSNSGSAYVFDLDGNELTKITASDAAASDFFGGSIVSVSGKIVVGAELEGDFGSAYIYDTPRVYTLHDGIALSKYGNER